MRDCLRFLREFLFCCGEERKTFHPIIIIILLNEAKPTLHFLVVISVACTMHNSEIPLEISVDSVCSSESDYEMVMDEEHEETNTIMVNHRHIGMNSIDNNNNNERHNHNATTLIIAGDGTSSDGEPPEHEQANGEDCQAVTDDLASERDCIARLKEMLDSNGVRTNNHAVVPLEDSEDSMMMMMMVAAEPPPSPPPQLDVVEEQEPVVPPMAEDSIQDHTKILDSGSRT